MRFGFLVLASLLWVAGYAQERSVLLDSRESGAVQRLSKKDIADLLAEAAALEAELASVQALLDSVRGCQEQAKFYDPTYGKADANGCTSAVVTPVVYDYPVTGSSARTCNADCRRTCTVSGNTTNIGANFNEADWLTFYVRASGFGNYNWSYKFRGDSNDSDERESYGGNWAQWVKLAHNPGSKSFQLTAGPRWNTGCNTWRSQLYRVLVQRKTLQKE